MLKTALTMLQSRSLETDPWGCARFLIALLLLVISNYATASNEVNFHRVLDGVTAVHHGAGKLTSIAQDTQGFMWFGGENGLSRFDGTEFKLYQPSMKQGALPSSYIRDIFKDKQNRLWVATDRGLSQYLPEFDRFNVLRPDRNDPQSLAHYLVTCLTEDHNGNLILGTGNGISILGPERSTFLNIALSEAPREVVYVLAVKVDKNNRLWVGTRDHGLILLDAQRNVVRQYLADRHSETALQSNTINTIEEDATGRVWVGTKNGGISRLDEAGRSFKNYRLAGAAHSPNEIRQSDSVWKILLDSTNTLWFATDRLGLAIYQAEGDQFVFHRHSATKKNSLSEDHVTALYEDANRNLWVSTLPDAIHFYDRQQEAIRNVTLVSGFGTATVQGFLALNDQQLWVATDRGIQQFDVTHQTVAGRSAVALNSAILSMAQGAGGDIWLGTWSDGIHKIQADGRTLSHYLPDPANPKNINSGFIWDLYFDSTNTLWIGTETGGLNRYDPDSNGFLHYTHKQNDSHTLSSNFVSNVLEDSRGRFWVATADGLDVMDRELGTFSHFRKEVANPNSISSVRIRALIEDSRGRIWIGTQDAGAFVYDYATDRFTRIPWPSSLSAVVTSFQEDPFGYLWASTTRGLGRIDPNTLAVNSILKSDGLLSDHFNRDASYKDVQGRLYFGSSDGFSVIDPEAIASLKNHTPLVITDFQVGGMDVDVVKEKILHGRAINTVKHIHLNDAHPRFSFAFAALNYGAAKVNNYAYRLDGFDTDWQYLGKRNWATYTNIGPGHYTFNVKTANRDDVWSEHIASVSITIHPPYWRSHWAYTIYAIILVLITFRLRWYIKRERRRAVRTKITLPTGAITDLAHTVLQTEAHRLSAESVERLDAIVEHAKRLSEDATKESNK